MDVSTQTEESTDSVPTIGVVEVTNCNYEEELAVQTLLSDKAKERYKKVTAKSDQLKAQATKCKVELE